MGEGRLGAIGRVCVVSDGPNVGWHLITYRHLSKCTAPYWAEVKAGQEIGLSGNTGHSTGPHLHIDDKHRGQYVDFEALV